MLQIALPMVVSTTCYTLMTFTDRMFLSKLGPELMSAAMAGGLTSFVMMTFFMGLIGYATALVAQYFGSGQKAKCSLALTQAFLIAVLAYPLILAGRPLAIRFFEVMGIAQAQLAPQKLYFNILLWAAMVPLLRNCLSCFFTGIGKTKIVMFSSLSALVVNVCVNYVLIFGKLGFPALGIKGAAIGTICGGVSGVLVLLLAYLNKGNRLVYSIAESLRFDKEVMVTLLRFGYPAGLELFLNMFAFDFLVLVFHSVSVVAATASTVMFNWDMVSFVPLLGVEIAVTSLVGRYMGAKDPDTAYKATMSGLKLGCAYSALIFILFVFFPQALTDIFRPRQDLAVFIQARPVAVAMIRMASLYVLVEAMLVVFIGALRGAGDTLWAMIISVTMHWILVPVLYVMLKIMGMPVETGWAVLVGIFFIFSGMAFLRFKKGHWRSIEMVRPAVTGMAVDDYHELSDL